MWSYYTFYEEVKRMKEVNEVEYGVDSLNYHSREFINEPSYYGLESVNLYSQVFIIDADCKENKINFERI